TRILMKYALHADTGRGAPIPRPPSLMSSAFAALISVHLVSTRILMEYALHTDTGRGAPIPRRTETYVQHICCTGQWPHRFQSNTDGVCIAYGYWRRRTESEATQSKVHQICCTSQRPVRSHSN